MKKFGFILIVLFSSLFNLQANTIETSTLSGPSLDLQKELIQLVGDLNVDSYKLEENQRFTVEFIVNNSGEIVVLNSSSEIFDKAIKLRLNYHMVDAEVEKNHKYILPITIKK